ncbi:MAG: autotransporter-associated beta strand repeat-containing protein, partial [Planctomycetales bacterium]|nr:autotransporter-associated beta strand repeat-containing protein [Planctomycetales bacterium]
MADTYLWSGHGVGEGGLYWANGSSGILDFDASNWTDINLQPISGIPDGDDSVVFGPSVLAADGADGFGGRTIAQSKTNRQIWDLSLINTAFHDTVVDIILQGGAGERKTLVINSGNVYHNSTYAGWRIDANVMLATAGIWDIGEAGNAEGSPVDVWVTGTILGPKLTKRGAGLLSIGRDASIGEMSALQSGLNVEAGGVIFQNHLVRGNHVIGVPGERPTGDGDPNLTVSIDVGTTLANVDSSTYVVNRNGTLDVTVQGVGSQTFGIGPVTLNAGKLNAVTGSDVDAAYYIPSITVNPFVGEFGGYDFTDPAVIGGDRGVRVGSNDGTILVNAPNVSANALSNIALEVNARLEANILRFAGGGITELLGDRSNSVATFAVQEGKVVARRTPTRDVFGGDLQIGGYGPEATVVIDHFEQIRNDARVQLFNRGVLQVNFSEQIGSLFLDGGEVRGSALLRVDRDVDNGAGDSTIATPFEFGGDGQSVSVADGAQLNFTGPLWGYRDIRKSGAGTVRFTEASPFRGAIAVDEGTLFLDGGLIRESDVSVAAGATLRSDGGIVKSLGLVSGDIRLGSGGLTVRGGTGAVLGSISPDNGAAGGLTLKGGLLVLDGPLSYTGPTVVDGGNLRFSSIGISNSEGVTLAAGTSFNVVTADPSQVTLQRLNGAGAVEFDGKTLRVNTGAGLVDDFAGALTQLSDTPGSLLKTGAGTLNLSGDGNFSGGTIIRGGVLGIGSDHALGTGTISLDGGTLRAMADVTLDQSFGLTSNGGTIDTNGQALLLTQPITGSIFSTVQLQLEGGGVVTLPGNNFYRGTTKVSGNTHVAIQGANSFGVSTNSASLDGATLSLAADASPVANLNVGPNGAIFELNGQNLTTPFAVAGAGALTLDDASADEKGKWVVPTANSYAGGTTIAGGTLVVMNSAGSATGNGSVTIDGGTLAGSGRIDSDAWIALLTGSLSPGEGATAGTLKFGLPDRDSLNGQFILEGGRLEFDLGSQSDLIQFTNLSTPLFGSGTTLALRLGAGFSYNDTYTLLSNVNDSAEAFQFAEITGYDSAYAADVFYDAPSLSYQLRFEPAGISGDFDGDGDVDGNDFLTWQSDGSAAPYRGFSLDEWQTHFGDRSGTAAAA